MAEQAHIEKKYSKKKLCGKVWKHKKIHSRQTNMVILMSMPYTVILFSLFYVAASSSNFSPALIRSGLSTELCREVQNVCKGINLSWQGFSIL